MNGALSPNAQAILLLTAPLIVGRGRDSFEVLTLSEYNRLARGLRDNGFEPADLLRASANELARVYEAVVDRSRLERLLGRGFLLSQAFERWQARAIWAVSRADANYPKRLKARLKEDAPPVIYGCGNPTILDAGGLAVVGSRHVDEDLVEYSKAVGRLAAAARRTIISGGARGIDQAAMRGAVEADGFVAGVLADSLERAVLTRDYRDVLLDQRMVLISPYDPGAGFNVGHAMQRNKIVYALADVGLVVSSDLETGGTWAGAVEQLERLHFVPLYVRSKGEKSRGLDALVKMGASKWPEPDSPEALVKVFSHKVHRSNGASSQEDLFGDEHDGRHVLFHPSGPRVTRATLRLTHVAKSRLRNMTPAYSALEAADETIVCWKVPSIEIEGLLKAPQLVIDPISADDFNNVYLYLAIKTESGRPSMALTMLNKSMAEKLTNQSILRIFLCDDRMDLDNVLVLELPWGRNAQEDIRRMISQIVDTVRSNEMHSDTFFAPTDRHRMASYQAD